MTRKNTHTATVDLFDFVAVIESDDSEDGTAAWLANHGLTDFIEMVRYVNGKCPLPACLTEPLPLEEKVS